MERVEVMSSVMQGDYDAKIERRNAPPKRPPRYEDLLLEQITHDEPLRGESSYKYWEQDHSDRRHFYVGGFSRFLRSGAVADVKELHDRFAREAIRKLESLDGWTEMPGPRDAWEEFSYNQVRHAKNGLPLYFQKAAIVILCCDLAVEAALSKKRSSLRVDHESSEDIYHYMSIIPACWNIDNFNSKYLEDLEKKHPGAKFSLRDAAGQTSTGLIEDLAAGLTVTRETAEAISLNIDRLYPDHPVGRVRARPGKRLGRKHASEDETFDRG